MDKGKGTAAGAVILAGLLLRPFGLQSPSPPTAAVTGVTAHSETVTEATGEGPWTASCEYWAPARPAPDEAPAKPSVAVKLVASDSKLSSTISASGAAEPSCLGSHNRWGIPSTLDKDASITEIVAAVPDPLRAHMALDFDRAIDAYLQAAGDNGYVESYYWIPWRTPLERAQAHETSSDVESPEARDRERQPGLIVLKQLSSYNHVIYLLLVRNTPALGMDGDELARAFKYEREVQLVATGATKRHDIVRFSPKQMYTPQGEDELAVIAAPSSGSAASLSKGIQIATKFLGVNTVRVAGGPTTDVATNILEATPGVNYVSFTVNDKYLEHSFFHSFNQAGYDKRRIAVLVEDGTVYGEAAARSDLFQAIRDAVDGFPDPIKKALQTTVQETVTTDALASAAKGKDIETVALISMLQARISQLFSSAVPRLSAGDEKQGCIAMKTLSTEIRTAVQVIRNAPVTIRFPRGISLLRNAHTDESTKNSSVSAAPSPYLQFSLHDNSIEDTVPRFSTDQTPISQEAQLMATFRQLRRLRIQFVEIIASDVLDRIFLAKSIHRALPDARVVSLGGGDLLYEREIDNVPYVGAVTISPYNLIAPVPSMTQEFGSTPVRAFSDANSEMLYNAASYIFWDGDRDHLRLANYRSIFDAKGNLHASLWATITGRDGYYPLGILNECASDKTNVLPSFEGRDGTFYPGGVACDEPDGDNAVKVPFPITPPISWFGCCALILCFCCFHTAGLEAANLWSPFTRDLAIDRNDEPCRRAVYIHIGTVMLFCIAFVTAYPLLPALHLITPGWVSTATAIVTLVAGTAALFYSGTKTWRHIYPPVRKADSEMPPSNANPAENEGDRTAGTFAKKRFWNEIRTYQFFHLIALLATILIPLLWVRNCGWPWVTKDPHHTNIFFSYRSLNPLSGVSPLLPVLLLLAGWYLWSVFQTRRLRFAEASRPRLPGKTGIYEDDFLFVSDCALAEPEPSQTLDRLLRGGNSVQRTPLYATITCLLITPEFLQRHFPHHKKSTLQIALTGMYLALFFLCIFCGHINSPERLLLSDHLGSWLPTSYELLVQILFFPLMMITLTGWLRTILIWGALSRGLLRQLEQRPIRFAFGRLNGLGWMALMRQNGLVQRWREMARSTESMRQMHASPEFASVFAIPQDGAAGDRYTVLMNHIAKLQAIMSSDPTIKPSLLWNGEDIRLRSRFRKERDVPDKDQESELLLVYMIENDYAAFSQALLKHILIPYWRDKRNEFVDSEPEETVAVHAKRVLPDPGETHASFQLHAGPIGKDQIDHNIRLAEEFVAIRYLSLIRAVLVNVRHLMTFVSFAFVLTIISWNSYPFRPREWVDSSLTAMLVILLGGIVWVFAQIHRDPILSRITRTHPNELGTDFYLRIAGFGAVPLLTWLAYQFPSVSNGILRYLQPSLEALK